VVGVWGVGVGLWAPTPHPPTPNPQSPLDIKNKYILFNYFLKFVLIVI